MFSEDKFESLQEPTEEIIEKDGIKYKKIDTGYTIREYFSHSTEKGPGPGWDFRFPILQKYDVDSPDQLPDDPYFTFEQVE